jgi:hypothetical protein
LLGKSGPRNNVPRIEKIAEAVRIATRTLHSKIGAKKETNEIIIESYA